MPPAPFAWEFYADAGYFFDRILGDARRTFVPSPYN
jgi:hypothetical protein